MNQRFPLDLNLNKHAKHVVVSIVVLIIWISTFIFIKSLKK